jgi:hypothetical protein
LAKRGITPAWLGAAMNYSVTLFNRTTPPYFRVDVVWRNEGTQEDAYEGNDFGVALKVALDCADANFTDVIIEFADGGHDRVPL